MRAKSGPMPRAANGISRVAARASELLVDEGRRLVLPLAVDRRDAVDDAEVVERQRDQSHRVRCPGATHQSIGTLEGFRHAEGSCANLRSMSATSARGVAHASRSNSAGEIVRPKLSSNATMRLTVARESSRPDV